MSTAVILAGGKSRRMGRDKLALTLDGKTFLERNVEKFSRVFDRVYLSVAGEGKYENIKAERVYDVYPGSGPMAGLHAGLLKTEDDGVFLLAGDMPFASPEMARRVCALCGDHEAAAIRMESGKYETAFAYYSKKLLPKLSAELERGHFKLGRLLDDIDVRWISPAELGELWDPRALDNINYPEDYERIAAQFYAMNGDNKN